MHAVLMMERMFLLFVERVLFFLQKEKDSQERVEMMRKEITSLTESWAMIVETKSGLDMSDLFHEDLEDDFKRIMLKMNQLLKEYGDCHS